jgi:predicted amidohydrolase YtcJ
MTEWAAYQGFTEDLKGTLAPGKLADLVILDRNPLKVEPMAIRDISVMETIKEGNSIYVRP